MFETMHPVPRRTLTAAATLLIAAVVVTPAAAAQSAQSAPNTPPASAVPGRAATAETVAIPDVALIARDGSPTSSAKALPAQGRWLLLHMTRASAASESLLARIQGEPWATVPPRLAIVVSGASAADVDQLAKKFPALDAATWCADEPGALATALHIHEAPLILAVHNRGIQWTLSGVLSGSKRLHDALTTWVAAPALPAAAAAR